MVGLQNAGKTSLLRVLAVCYFAPGLSQPPVHLTFADHVQGGEFTLE